jgi:hypothetical protein
MNPTAFIDLFAIPHQKGSLIIDEVQEHHVGWSQKDYSDQFVKHFNQMGKCELIRYETIILPSGETIDGAIFGPMTMGENIVVKGFVCTVPIKNNYLKVFATAPLASFESELEHFKEVVKSIKPL